MSTVRTFVFLLIISFTFADKFQDTLGHIKPQTSSSDQAKAVLDLIRRVIPIYANKFSVKVDPKIGPVGKDTFRVETFKNNTVKITGTTGVAAATGFHHYLKYYCHCHISWEGSQLNLPEYLPQANITITLNDRFRYYQNVCTTSYSFVWYDWTMWEKHIDWMALNSFNLVLAFNGQEAIWQRVYLKLKLTQKEIDGHFAGPAFLSWSRMGNLRGWGGPLSDAWNNRSLNLQKQIVNRMRQFGMITVLPAFAGHVPRGVSRIYPDANFTKVIKWNRFNDTYCCPYLIDPLDPIFRTIGNIFLVELISEFGTDHVYNCDTFNEMVPPTSNLTFLSNTGKAIYNAMTSVDPKAIWVLQGWMFFNERMYWSADKARALLESVPLGKMIVLDLQSEQVPQYNRLESYYGQPYIWCMLQNFGGTLGMLGSADIINTRVFTARNSNNSSMIGVGLTPEGINQNYVMYDLMMEMAWRNTSADLTTWFSDYVVRRYGQFEPNANDSIQILKSTVYNFTELWAIRGKYIIVKSPSTKLTKQTWYNTSQIFDSWESLLIAGNRLEDSQLYQHDLVDLTRQGLQNLGDSYYYKVMWAFKQKNLEKFRKYKTEFLEIFDDLESILSTSKDFLLGRWIAAAKNAATDDEDSKLFEFNARNQITLWGPNGEIKDYACKQWSGMMVDYYKPRWKLFLKIMEKSIQHKTPFRESKAKERVFKLIEKPFSYASKKYPEVPNGDPVRISQQIKNRWWPRLHKIGIKL